MASSIKPRAALGALLIAIIGAGLWLSLREHSEQPSSRPTAATLPHKTAPLDEHAAAQAAVIPSEALAPSVVSAAGAPAPTMSAPAASPVPENTPSAAASPAQPATARPVPQPAEVRATRAMYMAHAPLRTPRIADPDSEENRLILQSMVTKALSRASQAQPAPNK